MWGWLLGIAFYAVTRGHEHCPCDDTEPHSEHLWHRGWDEYLCLGLKEYECPAPATRAVSHEFDLHRIGSGIAAQWGHESETW